MAKLEGIIYKTFDHYVVLRGFASLKDLASISHKPESYQRNAIRNHKKDIIEFLDRGEYRYFPEITLACRVSEYEEFASNIGIDNAIDRDDAKFVHGLKILSERLPYDGYRARHAYLIKTTKEDLVRVDGNHRLEPFDNPDDEIWKEAKASKDNLEKLIVPFTVIFSAKEVGDKFEAGIFHNINFKQEPLRQEASLKIICDVDAFDDKEKLGEAYPLALKLIGMVKVGTFNAIPWLDCSKGVDETYYRTTCLRLSELLLKRKEVVSKQSISLQAKLADLQREKEKSEQAIKCIQKRIQEKEEYIKHIEFSFSDFKDRFAYRCAKNELDTLKSEYGSKKNEFQLSTQSINHLNLGIAQFSNYTKNCDNIDSIISAINIVQPLYKEDFANGMYGNISFLCAMVYYALLDKMQLHSFIKWTVQNGINKIIAPDDMSKDSSENLINMFEQIYQAKKNEIFISMQFGDSQSELIYEKIVRAIEIFNNKHQSIHLKATPIRIDRTVEPSAFSIQDEILNAIQSCSLIIADLSSANINVYHEIGYAMGIAQSNNMIPNMILLYKEDTDHNKNNYDVDKFIGFNLRNLSQLRFKDYNQLVDALIERLEKHYGV